MSHGSHCPTYLLSFHLPRIVDEILPAAAGKQAIDQISLLKPILQFSLASMDCEEASWKLWSHGRRVPDQAVKLTSYEGVNERFLSER
jgi:hypothetical protein